MKHLTAADREALADRLQAIKHSVLEELRGTTAMIETSMQPEDHEVRSHLLAQPIAIRCAACQAALEARSRR